MAPLEENFSLFQYRPELGHPVYLTVRLGDFESGLTGLLTSMGFSIVPTLDDATLEQTLSEQPHARVLRIEQAGARVAAQIRNAQESDRYGAESLIPHQGYRVYRYKGRCLMMFSFATEVWRAGVFQDFGSEQHDLHDRMILGRFLSWALSSFGIVGLFGSLDGKKLTLLKPRESGGQLVFIDWQEERIFSEGEVLKIGPDFELQRFDAHHPHRSSRMSKEQLISTLSMHSSFLSFDGLTRPIRQVLQAMATTIPAYTHRAVAKEVSGEAS